MIPQLLFRTVPEQTTDQVEQWWKDAIALHPGWRHVTLRDPVDPALFPVTGRLFDRCESGAQLADLIRIEYLYRNGGVYIDSDVEVYRSFEPLRGLSAFAGYENMSYIPNAIMGAHAHHHAVGLAMNFAVANFHLGTWQTGVGSTTKAFSDAHSDVTLFPPGSFYPVYWKDKAFADWSTVRTRQPWAFCAHHAAHSWKAVSR